MRTRYVSFIARKYVLADEDCQIIKLDPSSPSGYERKHVALQGAGHHKDTLDAFKMMLSKMSQSHDPKIRGEGHDFGVKFIC